MKVILAILMIWGVVTIPTNFDLRVLTDRAQYTNYDLEVEGVCAGYAWAK